jgi:hypothetical protein
LGLNLLKDRLGFGRHGWDCDVERFIFPVFRAKANSKVSKGFQPFTLQNPPSPPTPSGKP